MFLLKKNKKRKFFKMLEISTYVGFVVPVIENV